MLRRIDKHTAAQVPIYINKGKSKQRCSEERALRKLEHHAQNAFLARSLSKRKGRYCELLCDWVPILRVCCPSPDQSAHNSVIRPYISGIKKANIDVKQVISSFRDDKLPGDNDDDLGPCL